MKSSWAALGYCSLSYSALVGLQLSAKQPRSSPLCHLTCTDLYKLSVQPQDLLSTRWVTPVQLALPLHSFRVSSTPPVRSRLCQLLASHLKASSCRLHLKTTQS